MDWASTLDFGNKFSRGYISVYLSKNIHDKVFVVFKERIESLDGICHTCQDVRFLNRNENKLGQNLL